MDQIKVGSYVGIQYLGRQNLKGQEGKPFTQTNSYHIWKTFVDETAVNYSELSGSKNTDKKEASTTTTTTPKTTAPTSSFPEDDNDDLPF